MSRFANRPEKSQVAPAVADDLNCPVLRVGHPAIWDYLTIDRYDSGQSRKTSTLMVLVEEGHVKCCLNDRERNRSMWIAAMSLSEALDLIETHLDAGTGRWSEYHPGKKKK